MYWLEWAATVENPWERSGLLRCAVKQAIPLLRTAREVVSSPRQDAVRYCVVLHDSCFDVRGCCVNELLCLFVTICIKATMA